MNFHDLKVGLNEKDYFKRIEKAFPTSHPSYAIIFRWFREFKRRKFDFKGDERSVRPSRASSKENSEKLKVILKDTAHQFIQKTLNIESTVIFKFLHEDLKVRKRCSRLRPHELPEEQKYTTVLRCQEILVKFNSGTSKCHYDVVTGN